MPWRNRYITTRRHPVAIAAYLLTLGMGVFFLAGVFDSQVLNAAIGAEWQIAWQLLLTVGGAAAVAGVAWPQKHLEDALLMESAGAGACGCGLIVYCIAIVLVAGWSAPVWMLLGILAAGCLWRAVQARSDIHKVQHLAAALQQRVPSP